MASGEFGKTLSGVIEDFRGLLGKGKRKAYQMAATIEHQVENKEGIFGDIADIVNEVSAGAKAVHQDIVDKGGYKQAFTRKFDEYLDKIDTVYMKKLDSLYQKMEDSLCTDGVFDKEKGKRLLKDKTAAARAFGERTGKRLWELTQEGTKSMRGDFRQYFPDRNERETKYAGIGTAYHANIGNIYNGVLMRQDYEDVLSFHEQASKKMPMQLKLREEILSDIKASASMDVSGLNKFYRGLDDDTSLKKLIAIKRYF